MKFVFLIKIKKKVQIIAPVIQDTKEQTVLF